MPDAGAALFDLFKKKSPPVAEPIPEAIEVVEPPVGHLGQEGEREVHMLGRGPAERRRLPPYGEEFVEVRDGLVGRLERHEHAHGLTR